MTTELGSKSEVIQTIARGEHVVERSVDGLLWERLPNTHIIDLNVYLYRAKLKDD